jgi:hypothetical protein
MDLTLILGVLKAGLDLWNSKEGNKYRDRLIGLEKEFYAEVAKPLEDRSQLYLDERLLEINIIAKNFIQYATTKK